MLKYFPRKQKQYMNISVDYTLFVGAVALLLLLAITSSMEDGVQFCLAGMRTSVIRVLLFGVCITEHSESAMDGHPSTIKHPP